MSRNNGVRPSIEACVTVGTLLTLTGRFRVVKAVLDDLFGLTRWARTTVWPAQLTDGLIALASLDQMLDIDLHRWTTCNAALQDV